jgi:arabinogalactan oligomer / maltooligosaccharide transport system permease protein
MVAVSTRRPERRRRRERSRMASVALHAGLVTGSLIALFPAVWIALTSLQPRHVWQSTSVEVVSDPTLSNYVHVLTQTPFLRWFANTVVVAGMTTVVALFLAATTGYAVSRFRFPGMRPLMWSLLITQMFPVAILIVPLYTVMARIGLINHHLGLTLTYLTIAVPFCAWMLRGYFDTIPVTIDEAGRVDGLTPFGTFWRLVLPLAKPALAVVGFFAFITAWGEVAFASAFMIDADNFTLAVGLRAQFVAERRAEWGYLSAAAVMIAIPALLVFLGAQRHLEGGLTAGATKS